jgi:hypothetical protein
MLSNEDIDLLKDVSRVGHAAADAGDAVFELFTMGGVGNLNTIIQAWFESGDDDSEMTESGSVVLAGCVKDLRDGTALRVLLEFRHIYDINVSAEHVLADLDEPAVSRMLRVSRYEQVGELLASAGGTPSNRFLWTLRTYGRDARVASYLHEYAAAGNVAALVSLTIHATLVDWTLIAAACAETEFENRLLVNVALENIRRGAFWGDSESKVFLSRIRSDAREMFLAELAAL